VGSVGSLVALPLVVLLAYPTMLLLERIRHSTALSFGLAGGVSGLAIGAFISPGAPLLFGPCGMAVAVAYYFLVYRGDPDIRTLHSTQTPEDHTSESA